MLPSASSYCSLHDRPINQVMNCWGKEIIISIIIFLKNNLKSSKGSQTHCSLDLSGIGSFSDDSGVALIRV